MSVYIIIFRRVYDYIVILLKDFCCFIRPVCLCFSALPKISVFFSFFFFLMFTFHLIDLSLYLLKKKKSLFIVLTFQIVMFVADLPSGRLLSRLRCFTGIEGCFSTCIYILIDR